MSAALALNPIVLATGGTGGHVFPAEALAGELARRGHNLALITDARGKRWKGALAQHPIHYIRAASPSGGVMGKITGALRLGLGFLDARKVLRGLHPAAVVGFGGYASVPTVMAASSAGLPTVIHEQNAVLGRANRILVGRARKVATSFPRVQFLSDSTRAVLTGNPVRDDIRTLADAAYVPPQADGEFRLLVTGGSQGTRAFADVIPPAIETLPPELRARLRIQQQCRSEDLARVRAAYARLGVAADTADFFADIPARLAGAHLVVARAGASTVAELTASGRPSVLVPYPHATDDHQTANARALDEVGASILLPTPQFDAAALAQHLQALMRDPQRLAAMAQAARSLARLDAAQRLADTVEAVIAPNRHSGGAA
ncbi:MAG: UDP-N-acetylglucosamine--N-acetylmuramyl-(pentapeptide) pyrophosphoryl-undecaprenol [Alphaproteobacteria bacterium]|jgi:UDP-N-acetylglucosamine--N-acetylmuramyl-(pentapeptide) pyrophosphoryl-undecaprenol N-acetylglucosamine transferase|nr:UDP-N-acetylglucosamine--N-acetylmuramyl-(pentapeptide) pyrophosphoryl-undecaprenol [Alphaproteobacteria bacterium]